AGCAGVGTSGRCAGLLSAVRRQHELVADWHLAEDVDGDRRSAAVDFRPDTEEAPSVAVATGRVVGLAFASATLNSDIWTLLLKGNQGQVMGEVKRLTQDTTADFGADLSPDGNKMVWISGRSGNQEIWIRDLRMAGLCHSLDWRYAGEGV